MKSKVQQTNFLKMAGFIPGHEPVAVWVMPQDDKGIYETYSVKNDGSIWFRRYSADGKPIGKVKQLVDGDGSLD